jgi:hypothetical protein
MLRIGLYLLVLYEVSSLTGSNTATYTRTLTSTKSTESVWARLKQNTSIKHNMQNQSCQSATIFLPEMCILVPVFLKIIRTEIMKPINLSLIPCSLPVVRNIVILRKNYKTMRAFRIK